MDIIIPTFINAHLFWIIPTKDILLRSAMHTLMSKKGCKVIDKCEEEYESQMICVNINGIWARAIVESVVKTQDEVKYICWLPDYAVKRSVCYIYQIPESLRSCPHIAQKASLYNVVNMTTDLMLGDSGYEFKLIKTTEDVKGVRKSALDLLESAEKIVFSVANTDLDMLCGDIICMQGENTRNSLTNLLIREKLLAIDENMFRTMEHKRIQFRNAYFQNSASWQQPLDDVEKKLRGIIFNKDTSVKLNFFERTADPNRLIRDNH